MLKIEDIINRLKVLKEEDYFVSFNIEPTIDCFETYNGDGYEEIKYTYTITLEQKEPTIRKYKKIGSFKEYER